VRIIDKHDDIMALIEEHDNRSTVCVKMRGHPAGLRYPDCRLYVNKKLQWQGIVQGDLGLELRDIELSDNYIDIDIEFFGKDINDVRLQGEEIKENKCLEILKLKIDSLEIQGFNLIDLSSTDYNLTASQQEAYKKIGAPWQNAKTSIIYDNGIWNMKLSKPIVTEFIRTKQRQNRIFECSHHEILSRLQKYFLED